MSSGSVEKTHNIINGYKSLEDDSIDYDKVIIPFSEFGKTIKPSFIHDGIEEIGFNERHPVYQTILKNEFANEMKDFMKPGEELN